MTYKRFLIFAWDLMNEGEGIPNENPLDKIRESCDKEDEAMERMMEYSHFDFITVFDCEKRIVISDEDNIPF